MAVCESQFGGRVALTIGGQKLAPTEADIKMKTSQVTVEAKANQDGSPCYTVKPSLIECDVTFRRPIGGMSTTNMLMCSIDATIVEEDNGLTHLFTSSRLTGDPEENITNGELTGV